MKLLLAPMEGLADALLRELLTAAADYDWAVSEFARVSSTPLPARFFTRICPELESDGRTRSGTPVRVQLLGSDPERMAESAARLGGLRPAGIDLNFGCPAPTVNRHRGGAALLDEPELLHRIALAVRSATPGPIPCTAKMRLGIADTGRTLACAEALAEAGLELLVVHARTRCDGYRPPAHWEWVGRIGERIRIPVVANGEVWTEEDWRRCCRVAGTPHVMLGRGAVADPLLASRIRSGAAFDAQTDWLRVAALVVAFWQRVQLRVAPRHAPGRLKQWLQLLRRRYPQAQRLLDQIRAESAVTRISATLAEFAGGSPDAPATIAA